MLAEKILHSVNNTFDTIEHKWEQKKTHKLVVNILIFSFISAVICIDLKRRGFLDIHWIPKNHYYAINFVFTLLLIIEVLELVLSISKSVADSVGKQFEILSIILLRQSFKELVNFPEPISWPNDPTPIIKVIVDGMGALVIFIIIGFYYRVQPHHIFIKSKEERLHFVASKKLIALILLVFFCLTGLYLIYGNLFSGMTSSLNEFFGIFYTVLIFSDILIVFISLRYSSEAHFNLLFRNSGFALATVLIRIALTAPQYYNVAIGIFSALLALGLTLAYRLFMHNLMMKQDEE